MLVCFHFQQIPNVFGGKNAKAHTNTNTDEVNDQRAILNPAASDLYVSQLKSFIANNSTDAFDYRPNKRSKSKQIECTQYQQQQQHKHNPHHRSANSAEPKSQYKQLKRKCKRAVYKFMKGLFDERKLQKFKNFQQQQQTEPIYFEVSIYVRLKTDLRFVYMYIYNDGYQEWNGVRYKQNLS